jgi:hypothetical protein
MASEESHSTVELAKEQASSVVSGTADAAQRVSQTAIQQVGAVASESGQQLRHLWGQAQDELNDQAAQQQQRAAAGIRVVGDQLASMARGASQQGVATDLARQAAVKAHHIAGWLEARDPEGVLYEVRRFARRRPGTFLAAALVGGLVAGRLARSFAAGDDGASSDGSGWANSGALTSRNAALHSAGMWAIGPEMQPSYNPGNKSVGNACGTNGIRSDVRPVDLGE